MEQVIRIIFPNKTDSHWKIKLKDWANLSLVVYQSVTQKIGQGSNKKKKVNKKKMDIFWKYEKAKNDQQSFSISRGLNLLQQPQSQKPTYTEMLRNSSFTNANLDTDTL